jgi:hypothetical protein
MPLLSIQGLWHQQIPQETVMRKSGLGRETAIAFPAAAPMAQEFNDYPAKK